MNRVSLAAVLYGLASAQIRQGDEHIVIGIDLYDTRFHEEPAIEGSCWIVNEVGGGPLSRELPKTPCICTEYALLYFG